MICPFCEKEISAEINQRLESWGVIKISYCPKCRMCIGTESVGFNKKFDGWKDVRRIIKDKLANK